MNMVTTSSHLPLLGYSEEEQQQQTLSSTRPLTNSPSMIQDLLELHCFERQSPPDYLVLLHVASFGKQGSGLGSDESHVSMLTAKIFDIQEHSVSPCLNNYLARVILFEQKGVFQKRRKCVFI